MISLIISSTTDPLNPNHRRNF